ncbi:MAG TPA: hypothetical protein VFI70_13610 [Nitrososphaeraceae archaeon]|nr:hypothetical protein [Nitrososphaeraceae archaeon]
MAAALCEIVALGITTTTSVFALFPEQRFANGFRDGCNNLKLTGGHHTQEYINGYNKGIRDQGSICDQSLGSVSAATSSAAAASGVGRGGSGPQCRILCAGANIN